MNIKHRFKLNTPFLKKVTSLFSVFSEPARALSASAYILFLFSLLALQSCGIQNKELNEETYIRIAAEAVVLQAEFDYLANEALKAEMEDHIEKLYLEHLKALEQLNSRYKVSNNDLAKFREDNPEFISSPLTNDRIMQHAIRIAEAKHK